jgi:phospholipase C
MSRKLLCLAAFVAVCCSSCGGGGSGGSSTVSAPATSEPVGPATTTPIKHVIIMIQENRTFDDLFSTFPGVNGSTLATLHTGKPYHTTQTTLTGMDIDHIHPGFEIEYDGGKMDGFDEIHFNANGDGPPALKYPLTYVSPQYVQPYWSLAHQYALADNMFETQSSGSFTAHQDLIRGNTYINSHEAIIDFPSRGPWGCDGGPDEVTSTLSDKQVYGFNTGPRACFFWPTMRDLLDAKNVSWRYDVPPIAAGSSGYLWNAFDAIHQVRYSSEWTNNVIIPETHIFSQISSGTLANVTWVIPAAQNSDHPYSIDHGPQWVASVVNAIGGSQYWDSTAIIVTWDDWGGWFDHVVPPQIYFDGLGFRVPMLVISPYTKAGYVSHTQYQFASILKFVEDNWSLGRIGGNDVDANSISDCFDFNQSPRSFEAIQSDLSRKFFEHERPNNIPIDPE